LEVDDRTRIVQVEGAPAGRVPRFDGGEPGPIHDGLIAKMRAVFCDAALPTYLDSPAQVHLAEAREVFRRHALTTRPATVDDDHILLFPWRGTQTLDALRFALRREKLSVTPLTISLAIPLRDRSELAAALEKIRDNGSIDGTELADLDENLVRAKYDQYISRDLLRQAAALDRMNTKALPDLCSELFTGVASL
jgi:ATP-dependent Lhr-like helicase